MYATNHDNPNENIRVTLVKIFRNIISKKIFIHKKRLDRTNL